MRPSAQSNIDEPSLGSPSVAFLAASLSENAGGIAASLPATVAAVSKLGIEGRVFGLHEAGVNYAQLPYADVPLQTAPAWPTPGMRIAPQLDRILQKPASDVLHLHGLWLYPSISTLRWRRRTGNPVVISPHGMLDRWALENAAWKKQMAMSFFERANLKGASCLHALTESEHDAIRALGIQVPVATIPNGVTLPPEKLVRTRPAFLGDRRLLLFLGRLHKKKGISETLRAWATLVVSDPTFKRDWCFGIVGWGDSGEAASLQRMVTELSITDSVVFLGPKFGDEKASLLSAADAFVLASHSEGLPIAVLEAWSYHCAVFMTQECNLPEGFAAGAAIEISKEPEAMAAVLKKGLLRPDLRVLGDAGRALVREKFTWDRVGADFANIYRWLAGRGATPSCVRIL